VYAVSIIPKISKRMLDLDKIYMLSSVLYCMDKTVGLKDGKVRTVIGAVAGVSSLTILVTSMFPEILSPLLGLVSVMMLVTAYTGLCPMYSVIGYRTTKQ